MFWRTTGLRAGPAPLTLVSFVGTCPIVHVEDVIFVAVS